MRIGHTIRTMIIKKNNYYNKPQFENKNYQYDNKNEDKNYQSNQYQRRYVDKDSEKRELEKKIGNFQNILLDNEKVNQNVKFNVKNYDTEPTQHNDDDGISKPSFVNSAIGDKNFKDLNQDHDLYLKNLRSKGLDQETEKEKGEEGDTEENTESNPPKRSYTHKNNNYKYNKNRNYNENYEQSNNGNEDNEGFETVGNTEKHPKYNTKPVYKTNYTRNTEADIWNSVVNPDPTPNPNPEEEVNGEQRKERREKKYPKYDKYDTYDNKHEKYGKYDKYDQKYDYQTEEPYQEKTIEVVEPQQPTKVEFKMKGSGLKDLFKKKSN